VIDQKTEPDVARLSDHHELDLATMAGEAISLNEPIVALCEDACPGLCVDCGERLGPGHAEHEDQEIDPRLAAVPTEEFTAHLDRFERKFADLARRYKYKSE
jgi:uncharacterized protein